MTPASGIPYNGDQITLDARVNSVLISEAPARLTVELRTDKGIVKATVDAKSLDEAAWDSAKTVTRESLIRVSGSVSSPRHEALPDAKRKSSTIATLTVTSLIILAHAKSDLIPFHQTPDLDLNARLNSRTLSFRHAGSAAILRLHSGLCQLIVEFLGSHDFHWIHAPRLISHRVAGDKEYFHLPYFGRDAYLAQNSAYQGQMALSMDMGRVFDIGPAFRAEVKSEISGRHLTEFTVLGTGMVIEDDYHYVVDMMESMLLFVFKGLQERPQYRAHIETIKKHYPAAREFRIGLDKHGKIPRITFLEAKQLLRDELGLDTGYDQDLSEEEEAALGRLFRSSPHLGQTDVFTIDQYPISCRPFNTHPSTVPNPRSNSPLQLANAWDTIVGGREICSGSQRIHVYEDICAAMAAAGMGPDSAEWEPYREAFRAGMPRHGGIGLGVNRLLQGFLGLEDVREVTMFPRDVNRIAP